MGEAHPTTAAKRHYELPSTYYLLKHMTTMQDITKMNDKDLTEFLKTERETVRASRFNPASRDVRKVRTAKKNVARGLTEMNRRMNANA